jgi:hypothetical protein
MIIRPVGAEWLHAGRHTDRYDEANVAVLLNLFT